MMESVAYPPIAIFAYNRLDNLKLMLASLRQCHGFPFHAVSVFVDGPRDHADSLLTSEVAAYVESLELPNVQLFTSPTNRGLRASIAAGVTSVCREHGRVIVLEDDLELSPAALDYFRSALDMYAEDERIWSISGYAYDVPSLRSANHVLALPIAHPWGWATWWRAWAAFDVSNAPDDRRLNSAEFRRSFDRDGMYPWSTLMINDQSNLVSSWFIHWYYTIFDNGGRSVFPTRRLVNNWGTGAGTHGSRLNPYNLLIRRAAMADRAPALSRNPPGGPRYERAIRQCWELRVQRQIARLGSAKRRAKVAIRASRRRVALPGTKLRSRSEA